MLQSMGLQRVEYDLVTEQQQIHDYGMSFHLSIIFNFFQCFVVVFSLQDLHFFCYI